MKVVYIQFCFDSKIIYKLIILKLCQNVIYEHGKCQIDLIEDFLNGKFHKHPSLQPVNHNLRLRILTI